MNLNTARAVVKQLRKAGLLATIWTDMSGRVLIRATAGGFQGPRRVYDIHEVEMPTAPGWGGRG